MSNAILIKEVNNQPVIFNVDNAVDAARLEALQAVKMAEDMVASVFGEQSNFADNTTCIITDNPDNAEFPHDIVFDSSKIPSKPKRNTGTMAGIGMPSGKYINLATNFTDVGSYKEIIYTAPANGYIYFNVQLHGKSIFYTETFIVDIFPTQKSPFAIGQNILIAANNAIHIAINMPVRKGGSYKITHANTYQVIYNCFSFVYAQGEI